MLRRLSRLFVLGCVVVVASAGQAFTAPPEVSGAASARLAVSDVRYDLAPARPDLIARVTFTVSPAESGRLRLRLAARGLWRECMVFDGRAACDLSRAPVALRAADALAVETP